MSKSKKAHRIIAFFLAINILQSVLPINMLYASNNGPNAPEASGFEPVNATDMVNLASGDMAYVLPVMEVGGLPISLSYHGGVPLDLESTWTGLGWNINTGAINRSLNATPDDWSGGNSVDFIRYKHAETVYSVNVGVGISQTAEVGVGASWGSNKSLSGSVFATVGLGKHLAASASISTDGNYSLGISAGTGKNGDTGSSFGGGIGISGNVSGGKIGVGVGVGMRSSDGMTVGVGASLDGGMSASFGYNSGGGNQSQSGASGSLSTSSFSSGDWEVSSKGWYIPIVVPYFSFGFGKQKVTYTLEKGYNKKGYGILYGNIDSADLNNDAIELNNGVDSQFTDYQHRFRYIDSYDQTLPVSEKEFVGDYDAEREKLNFTFAGYDSYEVNGTGISGSMSPKILQNATVFGMGYTGSDPTSTNGGKLRVYNHNSLTSTKTFGKNTPSDIEFYFNGHFTQNKGITPVMPISVNNTQNKLQDFIQSMPGSVSPTASNQDHSRLKQGNYVEVFTNKQIKDGQALGLLSPLNPEGNGLSLQALSRTGTEYKDKGIGGYKITAPDGKIYHFSQPVYHFEQVDRTILKDTSQNHISEKRQYTPYATHWLLTAITGPDFVDTNNNNVADPQDYGYWVRMDYGKWSDGYVWRTPTDKNLVDFNTNIEGKIFDEDFGNYQFGRKQLYYLDRVVSATHTAYFVKSLRYDSVGSDLNYFYTATDGGMDIVINNSGVGGGMITPKENFTYKSQLQLKLDKIILVRNQEALVSKGNFNNPLQLNTLNVLNNGANYVKSYTIPFMSTGGFYAEYNQNNQPPTIRINNESGVYDIKDFTNFDYSNAIKVVNFDYNYDLAVKKHNDVNSKGSPGTIICSANPRAGKLCLKQVKFLGRDNFDYMPPYQFEYDGEYKSNTLPYTSYPSNAIAQKTQTSSFAGVSILNLRAKDEWGFLKERPQAWSMTKIVTPTGANIEFEHEEDDYLTEAFSSRFWRSGLHFDINNIDSQYFEIKVSKDLDVTYNADEDFFFTDYFSVGDKLFVDFYLGLTDESFHTISGCEGAYAEIDINKQALDIYSVHPTQGLTFRLKKADFFTNQQEANDVYNNNFTLTQGFGSSIISQLRRCPNPPNCGNGYNLIYTFLANKVPIDQTGGGLRVKSITLKDENNNKYKTRYYYNVPGTGNDKGDSTYKSSGITSYSPVKGTKFVPYQSQLPSPGVMYEYVTMVPQDGNGNDIGSTRYRYYTLKPAMNIFDENIEMKDIDGTTIFKATVLNFDADDGYLNKSKKIKSKSIKLDVNTSLIGQFKSIEEFNKHGQLLSKIEKKYLSGYELKSRADLPNGNINQVNRGSISESFQSMKSVFKTSSSDNDPVLKNRFLSVSTKEEYTSVLQSITTTGVHGKTVESYSKTDPATGAFMIVEKERANGSKHRIERVPAYTKYPEMGPKYLNVNNKNMLSQEAMTVTSVERYGSPGNWANTGAAITTWNKEWTYRDNTGFETTPTFEREKIWRKHKSFVYKSDSPYFDNSTSINTFNWQTGSSTNNNWKKVSEITRYNHYSSPIETKDINNNFASSKMADKQNKVIVSGNARYTEIYYSGAEYVDSNNSLYFEGEVLGAKYRSDEVAHTGRYSVKTNQDNQRVFEVIGTSGDNNYYQIPNNYTQTFRPGKYKVSFWGYDEGRIEPYTKLMVNDSEIKVSEIVKAGCWKQFNYYFDIPANQFINIHVKNSEASVFSTGLFYDDFRLCPIETSMNSYVYDHKTDELVTILDANNLGKTFVYDNAGRLLATYAETVDSPTLNGGFKITGQFKQIFKGIANSVNEMPLIINNCRESNNPLQIEGIELSCVGSYENTFKINTIDGSGNLTYQYKWRVGREENQYSNFVVGNSTQKIPYYAKNCEGGGFDKEWDFVVRVTDNVTGKYEEKNYSYSTKDCQYKDINGSDIEISKCYSNCNTSLYNFKIHLSDSNTTDSYKFEYAYFNPEVSFSEQNYIDVSASGGKFCPIFRKTADGNCEVSGYRDYVNLVYRVTNLTTNKVSSIVQVLFSGDCSVKNSENAIIGVPAIAKEYLKEGYVVKLDDKGNVLEVLDINKQVK